MKSFTCKDCEARTLGCHGSCEVYAQVRIEREAEKVARKKAYEADAYRMFVMVRNKAAKAREAAKH